MFNVGVFPGKFIPPHRGHLNSIINAATQCKKLYVVVSDNDRITKLECKKNKLRPMDLAIRAKWLSIELQSFKHIEVLMLDETEVPDYPNGWGMWSRKLIELIPEKFDVIFGGEPEYLEQHVVNFPGIKYEIFDYKRARYPISATKIRDNPLKYWDYILGSSRYNFAKRVLITGTESCGKSTITNYLGKIYHTSWTNEVGRYYSEKYLGGNENVFSVEDFEHIAFMQHMEDNKALKTCNKVVFFDTDAVVTQYYLYEYLRGYSKNIEQFVDPGKYDKVLLFTPDTEWVDDGLRFLSDQDLRWQLHKKLKQMYTDYGFGEGKIVEISGNYKQRLNKAVEIVDGLIKI